MKKKFNIFFAIDKRYVQHFTVAATSLLENNKDLDINIYVLHDIEDMSVLDITIRFIKEKYNVDLNFIPVGDVDFSKFRLTEHYPKSTYYRLLLADLVPEHINEGLFLDSDLIITGSLKPLADIDISQHYICAASEASVADNAERLNQLGFPNKSYFNAGVILVNLKKWREENLTQRFFSIVNQYSKHLEWVDQDVLNMCFANNWYRFDSTFNAIHLIRKLPVTPVIVHYASYSKPWYYVDTHPYNYLYKKYLNLTPFKGSKPVGFSLKNFILKNGRLFKRQLRETGILKYAKP
ncbi:glycosyltransferase family 8 protein [Mucilaginibacter koreensis]